MSVRGTPWLLPASGTKSLPPLRRRWPGGLGPGKEGPPESLGRATAGGLLNRISATSQPTKLPAIEPLLPRLDIHRYLALLAEGRTEFCGTVGGSGDGPMTRDARRLATTGCP